MPSSGATHRKTSNDNPFWVELIFFHRMFENLQRVDFACEFVRIAVATEGMNHNDAWLRGWVWVSHARCNEL